MPGTTHAVIYDCDGVLVDSEDIANAVMADLIAEAGIPTTFEEVMSDYRGRSMATVIESVTRRLGEEIPFDLADRYYRRIEAEFATRLQPVPGIHAALDAIDLPDCVASSGPHHKMEVTLRLTGLWERFAGRIFSADDVGVGKPAPDLFLHAAGVMGFDPSTTTVVEDSIPGVQAAVAAGMAVVAYASHTPAEVLAAAGALPFHDMSELPGLLMGSPHLSGEDERSDHPEGH